jgi:hypothetical protein
MYIQDVSKTPLYKVFCAQIESATTMHTWVLRRPAYELRPVLLWMRDKNKL